MMAKKLRGTHVQTAKHSNHIEKNEIYVLAWNIEMQTRSVTHVCLYFSHNIAMISIKESRYKNQYGN